jgi:hypothetical protein
VRFLPSVDNVGILCGPVRAERRAAEDVAVLERAGDMPDMAQVTGKTVLQNAPTRLRKSLDVLHAIPDTTVDRVCE